MVKHVLQAAGRPPGQAVHLQGGALGGRRLEVFGEGILSDTQESFVLNPHYQVVNCTCISLPLDMGLKAEL